MKNLTSGSWVKIGLIALLCLVVCAGAGGCFTAVQQGVNAAANSFADHVAGGSDALPNAGDTEVAVDSVQALTIDWLAGRVEVFALDDDACGGMIQVQERLEGGREVPARERMGWNLENGELSIVYGGRISGLVGCARGSAKVLTVAIPQSCAQSLGRLTVNGASGSYILTNVGASLMEASLASGDFTASGFAASSLDLDIASGTMTLEGSVSDGLTCDVMSGNVNVECVGACPAMADIDVASGSFHLGTPAESSYSVDVDRASGAFACPRAQMVDGRYLVGDDAAAAAFSVDMTSGNVTID